MDGLTLLKDGYKRYPQGDAEGMGFKLLAFRKRVVSTFTKVDLQGNLFEGFDTKPKCTINWSSSQQVIKLFEVLGIQVKTFDKKEKKTNKAKSKAKQVKKAKQNARKSGK